MRRLAFLLALAIQLCCAVTPADAFLVCVSADGCIELELAMPGTERCAEVACDSEHAAATGSHGCRDIPLLSQAFAASGHTATSDLPAPLVAVLPAGAVAHASAAASAERPRPTRSAPPPRLPHRIVVLQL